MRVLEVVSDPDAIARIPDRGLRRSSPGRSVLTLAPEFPL